MQYETITCQYDHITVTGSLDSYPVVSSSTCAVLAPQTVADPVSYYDFALFATIAIFLLAFIPAGLVWSVFKKQ